MRQLPLAAFLAGLACGPVPAATPIAEIVCAPTPEMVRKLEHQFGERRQARGTRGHAQVMEVWADDSGDWTLVMTYATGTSRIVAMGENWQGLNGNGPA